MKAIKIISVVFFMAVSFNFASARSLTVQPNALATKPAFGGFEHFNAHRQKTSIALSWGMTDPNVTGFIIESSWDGIYFTQIDMVPAGTTRWTKYNDVNAMPGYNYYRVTAVMSDGSQVTSGVECVRIVKHG